MKLEEIWALLMRPFSILDHLIEDRKLIRRLLVTWATVIVTYTTHEVVLVLRKMDEITGPVTSFYLGVTALLTAVIGFYQWSRSKDSEEGGSDDRSA